jgi:uncharacterized oligopeptide transporter (OPT) family protein
LYKAMMVALKGWKDVPEKVFATLKAGSISAEISPELLGVGYIIGPRIAATMCAGGVLAYLVLIPAIKLFGEAALVAIPPGTIPIREMGPHQIRSAYILYIGAGAVAAGGVISLARSVPTIWHGIRAGLRDVSARRAHAGSVSLRTDRDLSMRVVLIGSFLLMLATTLSPSLHMNLAGAALIVLLGFLFVTVSSRLAGELGNSSNPISGMTVATLLLTSGVFLTLGWTSPPYYVTALSVGAIVCIASANAGATSQDLKTGFLLGATPRAQQLAILLGALTSALLLGPVLLRLNDTGTVYIPQSFVQSAAADQKPTEAFSRSLRTDPARLEQHEKLRGPQAEHDSASYLVWHKLDSEGGPPGKYLVDAQGKPVYFVDPGINGAYSVRPDGSHVPKFDAPKATLMSYIIKGILDRKLPWGLVLLGVMISLVLELCGIASLPFAVGVYLPISSSTPIFAGGALRWLADRQMEKRAGSESLSPEELAAESDRSPGVLLSSGYIAGGAIAGIVIAFMAGLLGDLQAKIDTWAKAHNPFFEGPRADLLSLLPFALLAAVLYGVAVRKAAGTGAS